MMGLSVGAPSDGPKTEPMTVVQELVAAIRSYETPKDGKSLSEAQRAKNGRIAERAHQTLDFEGLAKLGLKKTWADLNPKEHASFLKLLKDLFAEVAYPQSAKFFGKLELDIKDRGLRKGQHVIEVAVSHPDEGLVDLAFFIGDVGGIWKVQDLTLDGVSLGRDIQSQMQRIVRTDGYPVLIERMKKKLKDEGMGS